MELVHNLPIKVSASLATEKIKNKQTDDLEAK